MLIDKIIFPEKQKKGYVDEILRQVEEAKTKKGRAAAVKRVLPELYSALVKLPFPFQIPIAGKIIDLVKDESGSVSCVEDILKTGQEKKIFGYISDISRMEPDYNKEADEILFKAGQLKDEIKSLLGSLDKGIYKKLFEKAGGINMLRFEAYLN